MMAIITNSTFDPLKWRCNVRLQQGVPIVDADWNELDDIRKFEMRAYLKWFVGDGIPDGNDGFRIDAIATGVTDDFIIRAGVAPGPAGTVNYDQGLRYSGRAIVDGLDVLISADINYKAQPLFTAAAFGVPQIPKMPTAAGPIAVVLDIWERLVTSQEDPSQVLPGIGTESCARMKRDWCVRTRAASTVPQPADADFLAGHSYYLLAVITRKVQGGNPVNIAQGDVQDTRRVKYGLSAVEKRLENLEYLLLTPRFAASPNEWKVNQAAPGVKVLLFGTNLNVGKVSVTFNTTSATVADAQPGQLTVVVPILPLAKYTVTITTSGGQTIAPDLFTVLGPSFGPSGNQFNPAKGAANTAITLTGSDFTIGGTVTPTVAFGTTAATIQGTPTDTQIVALVPTGLSGQQVPIAVTIGPITIKSTDLFTVS
jgi:hypothetical protein